MKHIQEQKHLGTDVQIQIISDRTDTPTTIDELFSYCSAFEQEFSRFLETSELSKLNKSKHAQVSQRFIHLLDIALTLKAETDWFFSPFVNLAYLWYSGTFENGVFTPEIDSVIEENIEIVGDSITLWKNTQLDFWWIGKGYLVDLLKNILLEKWFTDFCINAGWDLCVMWKNERGEDWIIWVENPFTQTNMGTFVGTNISVNTSWNYRRKWENAGRKYHHILNPLTGKNVNEFSSVTLIHTNCAYGDALTKGVWHTSFDELWGYFQKHHLEWMVIRNDGKVFASPGMMQTYHFERG